MPSSLSDDRLRPDAGIDLWSPSPATRFWLFVGIAGLIADLCLGVTAAVLEFVHWGEEGITPDVWITYAAIIPQLGVVAAWLYLARDAGARSLWKSTAGLLAAYLLFNLLSLTMWDLLTPGWNIGLAIAAGIGIVGLVIFTFSKWPIFTAAQTPSADVAEPQSAEEGGSGWWVHGGALAGFFVLRQMFRGAKNWMPNFGLDEWALFEMAALGAIGLGYALWFAVAKIRSRDKLGTLAAVLGGTELVIVAIHVSMLAAAIYLLFEAAAVNPQMGDDAIDKLLDPWLMRATVASAACDVIWTLLAAALFGALWMRPEPDWRATLAANESRLR